MLSCAVVEHRSAQRGDRKERGQDSSGYGRVEATAYAAELRSHACSSEASLDESVVGLEQKCSWWNVAEPAVVKRLADQGDVHRAARAHLGALPPGSRRRRSEFRGATGYFALTARVASLGILTSTDVKPSPE